ncbi:hypothetical protein T484DRAFT_2024658, partial [Baffinella frigidus]
MVRGGAMRFLSQLSALSALSALVLLKDPRRSPMPGGGLRRGSVFSGAGPELGGWEVRRDFCTLARHPVLGLALRGGDGDGEHEAEEPPLPNGDEASERNLAGKAKA